MRTIQYEQKVYTTTWETIEALAWASMRRGRNQWKSDTNVVREVQKYLLDHGASEDKFTLKRLGYVMTFLRDTGYATLVPNGKRFIRFSFNEDVDLRMKTPDFVGRKAFVEPAQVEEVAPTPEPLEVEGIKVTTHETGLPVLSARPPRYKAEELSKLLDDFAAAQPEAYADYADATITGLRSLLAK